MRLKEQFPECIRNIVFDFGGVILDIDISRTVKAFRDFHIRGLREQDIHPNQKRFFLDLELGLIDEEEFIYQLREAYPDAYRIPVAELWQAWNAMLLDYSPQRFEALQKIGQNYNIYLLSNTNLPHRRHYLDQFRRQIGGELDTYFRKCYYSDELKMRKPDARIYEWVLYDAGLQPVETLFIDDNEINFPGARQVGIYTYLLEKGKTITDLFQ